MKIFLSTVDLDHQETPAGLELLIMGTKIDPCVIPPGNVIEIRKYDMQDGEKITLLARPVGATPTEEQLQAAARILDKYVDWVV